MTRRIYLHIGAPKSGSTHLQSRLQRNAASLAAHGVLVPRASREEHPGSLAFRAALDLTGRRAGRPRAFVEGYWQRLVEQVSDHDGPVLVSHEAFARADSTAAERALGDLSSGGAIVHVVYAARDLARQLVSLWLEGLRHGGKTRTFEEYLTLARTGELALLSTFDAPGVLNTWGSGLPREQLHLVTVPRSGSDPDLLWRRFLGVAGVDPAWAPLPARTSNESVGVPEAQVLLALNAALGTACRRGGPLHPIVRDVVVERGLVGRSSPRVELDPRHFGWVEERATGWIDAVAQLGIPIHGDLEELRPRPVDPDSWVDPARPHPEVASAAASALAVVIEEAHRRGQAKHHAP